MQKIKGILKIINNQKEIKVSFLDLPVYKKLVIKKSIEKFNDSDPCIINYTIALKAVIFDLIDILNKNKRLGSYTINTLPNEFIEYINIKEINNITKDSVIQIL